MNFTTNNKYLVITNPKCCPCISPIEIKKIVFFSYFQGDDSDGDFFFHAMAVVQALKGKWKTFGELCDAIFNSILKSARHWKATRLDFVADHYLSIRIKDQERNRRAENSGIQKVHNVQWKGHLFL